MPSTFPIELKPETLRLGEQLSEEIASIQNSLRDAPFTATGGGTQAPGPAPTVGGPAKTLACTSLLRIELRRDICTRCTLCSQTDAPCPIASPISIAPVHSTAPALSRM